MPQSGQFIRGAYLLGLVIYVWVGGFILCCVTACFGYFWQKKYGAQSA